jgi:uncharacterized membrane protein YesL
VIHPFAVVGRAAVRWWDELIMLMLLNMVWALGQLLIVTGPPATAVYYDIARRVYKGELWEPADVWRSFKRLFWPAWRWGLLNGLVAGLILFNLLTYWQTPGTLWLLLRLLWGGILIVWVVLTFFYWPFWLAQEDKSLKTTYANCGRFLLLNPFPAVTLVVLGVVLLLLSLVTTLPFFLAVMGWLSLLGVTAVEMSLELQSENVS